jgi:TRAP-type mannitol/chloroaromatic compound transport system substrate-binding protein
MSGGRVQIDVYSAAELVPDEQCLQAVQSGTLDVIHHCAQSINLPLDIYDVDCIAPFLFDRDLDYWAMSWRRGLAEIYEEAYMELGDIQYIGFITHDPSHLISTKPIWSYDDLDGLKINAFAPVARPFVDAGAVSVVLPVEEFYLSGQTGVVDALCWCGATEASANSWFEVYNYFLTNPVTGGPVCHTLMNKELWDSLPADLQAIMKYAEYILGFSTVVHYYNGEPVSRKNFDLTTMPDEDWARVLEHGYDYLDEVAAKSERNARILKIMRDFRTEMQEADWWRP